LHTFLEEEEPDDDDEEDEDVSGEEDWEDDDDEGADALSVALSSAIVRCVRFKHG